MIYELIVDIECNCSSSANIPDDLKDVLGDTEFRESSIFLSEKDTVMIYDRGGYDDQSYLEINQQCFTVGHNRVEVVRRVKEAIANPIQK